ncbi:hypothetical protein [Streptomyces olivaceus]|uniref:hypothetical protein n=1 Tax=Streptomyces olivaceus TaxID=47716 RepID=UPI0036C1D487
MKQPAGLRAIRTAIADFLPDHTENQRRYDHAADRQGGPLGIAQVAVDELLLEPGSCRV